MIQEVTYDQLIINYDFDKVQELSKKYCRLFPANQELKVMLQTIFKIEDSQHLFISSPKGAKIESFMTEWLNEKEISCFDWCYVHNFRDANSPILLRLNQGKGTIFKTLLESSVSQILEGCKKFFSGKELKQFEKALKNEILSSTEKELEALKEQAKILGFATHISEKGVFFIPIINGKKISESEYDDLSALEQENIIKDLDTLEKVSNSIMKKMKKRKKESKNRVKLFKRQIIRELIDKFLSDIYEGFRENEEVTIYLNDLKVDLETQLNKIFLEINREQIEKFKEIIDFEKIEKENRHRYLVNYIERKTANQVPVIYASKVTYYELFGKIEYLNEAGIFVTDFTCIQPGLIHQANGGYLILDINDLISSKLIWDKLKKVLIERGIGFDNIREQLGSLPIKTICPQNIPLNLHVILMGEESIYEALYEIDPEFREIFSYHLTIPEIIDVNEENMAAYAAYFEKYPLTQEALKRVLINSIKKTGNKKKMTTNLVELEKLIKMSEQFAKEQDGELITEENIIRSESEFKKYNYYHFKDLENSIINGQMLIETEGKKIGQINGLSVTCHVDYEVAYPIRITATSYAGEEGIICVEKENKMSGKVFGKGLGIISGYLNTIFAKEEPLPVNCLLCFEQMYGSIDGDSASCAEIYAILSALSQIPINQEIAITGSIDQFGNVQPIGSVSTKIEGFFNVCKLKGLTGKQGVIIPHLNKEEVILSDELLEAVQKKKFHIYCINSIEDGIDLVMNSTYEKVKKAAHSISI